MDYVKIYYFYYIISINEKCLNDVSKYDLIYLEKIVLQLRFNLIT